MFGKNSLCVLITRPQPQANELATKLTEQGNKAIVFPTFSIEDSLDQAALHTAISTLDQVDVAIFVSPRAVEKTLPIWLTYWPKIPKKILLVAVGKSTEQALKAYLPVQVVCPEDEFNSEALLALPDLQAVHHKIVMIFQGETGRGLLEKVLTLRGAKVKIAICYRRVLSSPVSLPEVREWQQAGVNRIVYTSAEGMLNLFKLVDDKAHDWLKNIPSLVVSPRLVELAKEMNIQTVIQSRSAHVDAIIETLNKEDKL